MKSPNGISTIIEYSTEMSIHIQSFCTNSNRTVGEIVQITKEQGHPARISRFIRNSSKTRNVCETILCHDSSTSPSVSLHILQAVPPFHRQFFSLMLSPSPFPKQITQKDSLRPHVQAVPPPQHKKCVCNAHIYYTVMRNKCKEKT